MAAALAGSNGLKCIVLILCILAFILTIFGSFSRQAFILDLGVGVSQQIDLTIHFGYTGFCIFEAKVGCIKYADKYSSIQPIEEETLLRVGQCVSYVAIGLGIVTLLFLGSAFMVNLRQRTYDFWGRLIGVLLPTISFAIGSLGYGFSDCTDQSESNSSRCRPGLGSIVSFIGGALYLIAACILCCCIKSVTIVAPLEPQKIMENKVEESEHGSKSLEQDPVKDTSISSEEKLGTS